MIYLGIGSNLSGAFATSQQLVGQAIALLATRRMRVCAISPLYLTPPVGPKGQGAYVNACLAVTSNLSPTGLLSACHAVEAEFGRLRRIKWGARTLDIDILDYYGQILDHRITLPHPRISHRSFVLVPLSDIAPAWRHPVTGAAIEQLKSGLPIGDIKAVKRL